MSSPHRRLMLLSVAACIACGQDKTPQVVVSQNVGATTPVAQAEPQTGLDLRAVGELVRQGANTPQDLERMINDPSQGINNLDLDQDGQVDYISVVEFADGTGRGFKFTDAATNPVREVATVNVAAGQSGYAQVSMVGNPAMYGNGYQLSFTQDLANAMLLSYALAPHPIYVSPYHYGYYPTYYRPIAVVPYSAYHTRVGTVVRTTTIRRDPPRVTSASGSANTNRTAPTAPRTIPQNPSVTQKAFSTRDAGRPVATGGFGRPAAGTANRSTPRPSISTPRPSAPRRRR